MQRIFIGIPVDRQSQKLINQLLRPFKESLENVRWVPEQNRHLTLEFLGDIQGPVMDELLHGFDETYRHRSRFQYRLSVLTRFPDSAGSIIALAGQPVGPLEELFIATRKLLDKNDIGCDQRKFRPHITLGRFRKAGRVRTAIDQQTKINMDIDSVVLYQSTLTQTGSIYSRLIESKLNQ